MEYTALVTNNAYLLYKSYDLLIHLFTRVHAYLHVITCMGVNTATYTDNFLCTQRKI